MDIERIRDCMRRAGMNQSALARATGATQGTIQQILDGSTKRSRLLPDIARALGTTTEFLLGDTDDPSGTSPQRPAADRPPAAPPRHGEEPLATAIGAVYAAGIAASREPDPERRRRDAREDVADFIKTLRANRAPSVPA